MSNIFYYKRIYCKKCDKLVRPYVKMEKQEGTWKTIPIRYMVENIYCTSCDEQLSDRDLFNFLYHDLEKEAYATLGMEAGISSYETD